MEHFCVNVEHFWSGDLAPSIRFRRSTFPRSLFAAAREDVFPPSEDPLASFEFFLEFLPAIDFGEGFRLDEPFNFDDSGDGISMIATGNSPSYGAYGDDSCSFSVESSVWLRRRRRRHHKRHSPNRLYRKESVKLLVRVCPWRLTVPLRQRGGQRSSGLHATASTRLPRRLVWASSW